METDSILPTWKQTVCCLWLIVLHHTSYTAYSLQHTSYTVYSAYVCPLDQVFATQPLVIGPVTAPEDFGADHQVTAFPTKLLDGLPHDLLGSTRGIHLSIVKAVGLGLESWQLGKDSMFVRFPTHTS